MPALGCICRHLARNGGGPYMLTLGRTRWCWAVHAGVWLEMEVSDPTRWRWVPEVGAGRARWRSAENVTVGSYTLVWGLT